MTLAAWAEHRYCHGTNVPHAAIIRSCCKLYKTKRIVLRIECVPTLDSDGPRNREVPVSGSRTHAPSVQSSE